MRVTGRGHEAVGGGRSTSRSGRAAILLLASALVLAACGGDDDDSEDATTTEAPAGETTTSEAATETTTGDDTGEADAAKQDYLDTADQVCVGYTDEINALGEPTTDDEFVDLALQAVELTRQELEELRALPMPPGDEETITAIYDAVESALDQIEADPMVLRGTVNPLAEASGLAADYGFQVCGQG